MIKSLFIKNYALIEEMSVEFSNGLVIITGETGAGKSIIIDALGLIIGDRASADVVRAGSDKAVIEGVFDITGNKKANALLKENEMDPVDDMIIRREISAKGPRVLRWTTHRSAPTRSIKSVASSITPR